MLTQVGSAKLGELRMADSICYVYTEDARRLIHALLKEKAVSLQIEDGVYIMYTYQRTRTDIIKTTFAIHNTAS